DVERGFSINENIISSNRSLLSQLSINSLRTTYDTVKNSNGGYSHNVPIHKELIKAAQSSFSFYNEELSIIKAAEERIKRERKRQQNLSRSAKTRRRAFDDTEGFTKVTTRSQFNYCGW
ncbi:unnamed protein product, partial [Rotaria magnacalcarata]